MSGKKIALCAAAVGAAALCVLGIAKRKR